MPPRHHRHVDGGRGLLLERGAATGKQAVRLRLRGDHREERTEGRELGIEVERRDNTALLVASIEEEGLVAEWNANTSSPRRVIKPGQIIAEVNGARGNAEELLRECRTEKELHLWILRSPQENWRREGLGDVLKMREAGGSDSLVQWDRPYRPPSPPGPLQAQLSVSKPAERPTDQSDPLPSD